MVLGLPSFYLDYFPGGAYIVYRPTGKPDVRCNLYGNRGKSGHHRAGYFLTGSRSNAEQLHRNKPPGALLFWLPLRDRSFFVPGKGEMVV